MIRATLLAIVSWGIGSTALACRTSAFLETTGLQCVSCAIEEATGGISPSEKWLAVIAANTVQQYPNANPYSTQDYEQQEARKRNLYRRIGTSISSFGFCASVKINSNGEPTDEIGYGNMAGGDFWKVVSGSRPSSSRELKAFAKGMGFKDWSSLNTFVDDPDFDFIPATQRQSRFLGRLKSANDNWGGNLTSDPGIESCLNQMRLMQGVSSNPDRPNTGQRSPFFVAGDPANTDLCATILAKCGVQGVQPCDPTYVEGATPKGQAAKKPSLFNPQNGWDQNNQ